MIQLVSETSEEDIARTRVEEAMSAAVAELAANLIRVARGAGKPYEIESQVLSLAAILLDARQKKVRPSADAFRDALDIRRDETWVAIGRSEDRLRDHIQEGMVAGALQIAASRLMQQRTQEAAGEKQLSKAQREMETWREERRAEWKAAERGAAAARKALKKLRET